MKKVKKSVKKQLLNILFVVVLVGITLTVLLINYKDELNFDNIQNFFAESNPWFIAAAFGCMLLFILFEAISLFFILRKLGHKSKFSESLAYANADTYYSAITPSATGGQPAAGYYMARDGVGPGRATFGLVLNLIGYTSAILIMGVVSLIMNPNMISMVEYSFSKVLVIFGVVMQVLLLGLFIACMFFGKVILKLGGGIITLLTKMKIVKNPEKWRKKLAKEVEKFRASRALMKKHPDVIIESIIFNVLQRVSQTFIPIFIILAIRPNIPIDDLFTMQVLVLFGYNCIPLPGGTGAYEYLYLSIYELVIPEKSVIAIAMMMTRLISYYFCIVVSGVYTLIYHFVGVKRGKAEPAPPPNDSALGDAATEGLISESELRDIARSEQEYKPGGETGEQGGAIADCDSGQPDGAPAAQDAPLGPSQEDGEPPTAETSDTPINTEQPQMTDGEEK